MPRILIATDSFKHYKRSTEIVSYLTTALSQLLPTASVIGCPLADGGEGTLQVIADALGLPSQYLWVCGPMGRPVKAAYLLDTSRSAAYVVMSEASGIEILSADLRNCYHTTSYGTGQLIRHCLDQGVKEVHLFVGGSATCDMGLGMLAALGHSICTPRGILDRPAGKDMVDVSRIDLYPPPSSAKVIVYADVDNVLYGPQGAAYIYGPQKGADPSQVTTLDKGLRRLAAHIYQRYGIDLQTPGAGAAGGMVAGAMLGLGATIQSGGDYITSLTGLQDHIAAADIIITGEGSLDKQTPHGKVVSTVCGLSAGKPIIALCGKNSLPLQDQHTMGISHIVELRYLGETSPATVADTLHLSPPIIAEHIRSSV